LVSATTMSSFSPPSEVPAQPARSPESEELFRLLVESVHDYAIFLLDSGGRVATWNAGAERIKGYRADEIIGRHFSTFYPEEVAASGICERELEIAASEGRFEDEGWRVRKDGTQFWANVVISAVRDRRGELVGFSKVTRDLTERKRAEEDRAARLAAERANRAKDEFLAMLAHELRNPLAPILTALQLMKLRSDGRLSKEQEVIERQVGHMVSLVEDLLDVSRIAEGKLVLKMQRVDLRDAVAKAVEIASPLVHKRRHEIRVDVPAHELSVDGDESRLTQIFSNLITNAAKYTPPGGHIQIRMAQQGGEIVGEVIDDGIGMDAALLLRVFELFVQGDQGEERAAGGLGIGLTLVRKLVDLHGGSVEAHSEGLGRGSRFTVRMPAPSPVS
jgi:PAS domain S-box-containing protein